MTTEFDVTGPLPEAGVTVLEASAGTGKTAALEALVTRFVAERGVALADVLAVTFTRAATSELRERVRSQLQEAVAHLQDAEVGRANPKAKPLLRHLAACDAAGLAVRRGRLQQALAAFDAATITTIHGFCAHALRQLGLAGDHDPEDALLAEPAELVDAVIDDVLAATDPDGPEPPSRRQLAAGVGKALANPAAEVGPEGDQPEVVALRVRLVGEVLARLRSQLRAGGAVTYDGLVRALAGSLEDEQALDLLRRRYAVVLVDEFQDTDHTQWSIFQRLAHGRIAVLIGDPKQAIYAFRGADVDAYRDATKDATPQTLTRSWRSDGRLLDALNALLEGVTFGEHVRYHLVQPAEGLEGQRMQHPEGHPVVPMEVRILGREEDGDAPAAGSARQRIADDVAARVKLMVDSGCTIAGRDDPAVHAGDLAVLTRTNAEARMVQRKLVDLGVPAVLAGAGDVLHTPAAAAWRTLLAALERPSASAPARALALTPLLGWSAARVATAPEADWDALHEQLHRWSHLLTGHGVAALYRTLALETGLATRLLGQDGGERALADLDHVAEVLDAGLERTSPLALAAWLREERDAPPDSAEESRDRRLETDARAVKVMTVHRAKGLEFGVVYVPFLASGPYREYDAYAVHDPATGRRMIHVGGREASDHDEVQQRAAEERWAEDLRLLYVALTRARHRAILWWAPVWGAHKSPLASVLFCRDADGRVRPEGRLAELPSDDDVVRAVQAIGLRCDRAVRASVMPSAHAKPPRAELTAMPQLRRAVFERTVDRSWRRTSYTALVAGAHAPVGVVPGEAEQGVKDDEAAALEPAVPQVPPPGADLPVVLGDLRGGAVSGTFVHAVFEQVDFAAGDLAAELHPQVLLQAARTGVEAMVGDGVAVTEDLRRVVTSPLGPLLGGDLRLADVTRADRRDELWFELPLAGGLQPDGALTVHAVADLLEAHLPPDDPLAGYAALVRADPSLGEAVRGYLAGAIDLVLRVPGPVPRFAVVDYKTTTLGGETPSAWDYRPDALAGAMVEAHYPLQALVYVVALHRYLRWRLGAAYDPDAHLAGVLYLFLRGMVGPDTPRDPAGRPCGVFAWRPPTALVLALSDLFDEGAPGLAGAA